MFQTFLFNLLSELMNGFIFLALPYFSTPLIFLRMGHIILHIGHLLKLVVLDNFSI